MKLFLQLKVFWRWIGAQSAAGFEARFTASRMAQDYVSLYESIATVRETSAKSTAALSLPQSQLEEHLIL